MIKIKHRGSFMHVEKFMAEMSKKQYMSMLRSYGAAGVEALKNATPTDTGKTAASWSYEVERTDSGYAIYWKNSNVNDGVNIAVIIQFGHGTGTGGYVRGIDYINPALQHLFQEMADEIWREVKSA